MNKIECLLSEYCPHGVEYKRLGDIASITRGGSFQKKDYVENGFQCIHYGQIYTSYDLFVDKTISFISADKAMKQKKAVKNDVIMAVTSENIDDVCKCVAWLGDDEVAVSGHTAIIHHDLNPKYLVYYLNSSMFYDQKLKLAHGTKVIEVTPSSLERIEVPVPPLEVQREIVRVLDNFTLLQAELSAELSARSKQYEYYRARILNSIEAEEMELGEVCNFIRGPFGGSLKKECFKDEGYAVYEQQHAIYGNHDIRYFIDDDKFHELKRFEVNSGDLIVSCSGTIGQVYIIPEDAPKGVINQALLKLTPLDMVDKNYIKYFFENKITAELNNSARGGAIKNVPSVAELKKIKILVPSLEKQREIVEQLDRFSNICFSMKEGIPAEIEGRKKQYAYYRDRLLSFKRG